MQIVHLRVHHFRSIADCTLTSIRSFNVLIGHSGKSNLIYCIDTFFSALRPSDVLVEKPEIGKLLVFHNRDTSRPIDITIVFSMPPAERDRLIRDIVSEVSEMRHAVEGVDPSLLLSVTLRAALLHEVVVWVKQLALVSPDHPVGDGAMGARIVMEIAPDAAQELYARRTQSRLIRQRKRQIQRVLERFDHEDWSRYKRVASEGVSTSPLRHMFRERLHELSSEMRDTIEGVVSTSSSYEEVRTRLSSMETELDDEAKQNDTAKLPIKISTITGEVASVPSYVRQLIGRLAKNTVLHLRERRMEIGAEEADRLLKLKVSRAGSEVLQNIQQTVHALLGVQVDAFAAETTPCPGIQAAGAELDVDNFLVEANGSGIREALRIVLDFEFGYPRVLLIEEPEVHLHPALETSMLRYLTKISDRCRVFIATQSTNLLDSPKLKNVYLISEPQSTQSRLLTLRNIEDKISRKSGIRLSSLFMYDSLIFVEGTSDESILREMASTLGYNFSRVNAGFIGMGGARNFTYYASDVVLSFL